MSDLLPPKKYVILEYPSGRAELVTEIFDGTICQMEVLASRKNGEWRMCDGSNESLIDEIEEGHLGKRSGEISEAEAAMILFSIGGEDNA